MATELELVLARDRDRWRDRCIQLEKTLEAIRLLLTDHPEYPMGVTEVEEARRLAEIMVSP